MLFVGIAVCLLLLLIYTSLDDVEKKLGAIGVQLKAIADALEKK
jgi:hypothetical protein